MLALQAFKRKAFDEALQAIAGLEKKQPQNPMVFQLRGEAYMGKKDFPSARKNFEHALELQPSYFAAATSLAQIDLLDKKPDEARKRYERILEKDKKNFDAMLALAGLANLAGDEKGYVSWLERAAKSGPAENQPYFLLTRYYLNKGQPQRALATVREAAADKANEPEMLELLGLTQAAAGEKENARSTFSKLTSVAPASPVGFFRLGALQLSEGKVDDARTSLERALQLKADFLDAEIAMISLNVQQKRYAESLELSQRVQKQFARNPVGYVLEGDILMEQKKYAQAAKAFETAYGLGKAAPILFKLHGALSQGGQKNEAEAKINQWLKEHPDDTMVRVFQGDAYLKEGRVDAAIAQYQAVLQKNPKEVGALNNLAALLQKKNDPHAVGYAERAYQLRPELPAIADTYAMLLLEQGDASHSIQVLRKVLATAPKQAELRFHLAQALVKAGNKAEARQELETALASKQAFSGQDQAKTLLKQLQ